MATDQSKGGKHRTLVVLGLCLVAFFIGREIRSRSTSAAGASDARADVQRKTEMRLTVPEQRLVNPAIQPVAGASAATVTAAPPQPDVVPYVARPAFRWHPRDPNEWQGMLIDLSAAPPCYDNFCQGALACVDQQCGPCERDSQCMEGEVCVLDYCVRKDLASCRQKADCSGEEFCVLTGLSDDHLRENTTMKALCSGGMETIEQSKDSLPAELFVGSETVHDRMNAALNAAPEVPAR